MKRREVLIGITATAVARMTETTPASAAPPPLRVLSQGDAGVAAIGFFHEFGEGAFVFDYAQNRAGKLTGDASSPAMSSTFDSTGLPIAPISYGDSVLRIGDRSFRIIPIRRRSFTAANAGATLAAEIAVREDRQPVGSIMLIYGSGPAPKEAFDFWAFHFLARGWSVVTYDKRGSGKSTGDWRLAGLETLAGDARAVVAALHKANLLKTPFGVWGASQAGWIMPHLGADGLVDFMVMHAGAATTPGQQILDNVEAELTAYSFPPDEIAKARAYYTLDTDVSRGRTRWSEIEKAHAAAAAAKAEWLLGPPAPANAPERTFIRLVADFDPAPYWRKSKAPLLALFGGKDVMVPPAKNQPLLKSLIAPGTLFEDVLLPQSNHLFMLADTGVRAEYAKRTAIDPGYFGAIDRWLGAMIRK